MSAETGPSASAFLSCLQGFRCEPTRLPGRSGDTPALVFELGCPECGTDRFDLTELSFNQWAVGVEARCCGCGVARKVFDAATDGYDGVLGNNTFLAGDRERRPINAEAGRPFTSVLLAVEASYSVEWQELVELAEEDGVSPEDLFDSFHLLSRPDAVVAWETVWDYECA